MRKTCLRRLKSCDLIKAPLILLAGTALALGCATKLQERNPAATEPLTSKIKSPFTAPKELFRTQGLTTKKLCKQTSNNLVNLFAEAAQTSEDLDVKEWASLLGLSLKLSDGNPNAMSDQNEHGEFLSESRFLRDNILREQDLEQRTTLESRRIQFNSPHIRFDSKTAFGLFQHTALISRHKIFRSLLRASAQTLEQDPEEWVSRCGTRWVYEDPIKEIKNVAQELKDCTIDPQRREGVVCFGKWITLCPHLAISYEHATHASKTKADMKCEKTFKGFFQARPGTSSSPAPLKRKARPKGVSKSE